MNFVNDNVNGADVSFYQDNNETPQKIDFSAMVGQGADFVIIRAGQNIWIDEDFQENWRNAKEAGLPRGSYWFYDSRIDPLTQAELFAMLFMQDPPELELWLDLEEHYGGIYGGYANWKKFLNKLHELLPSVRIGIYTGYYYITGRIPASEYAYFSQYVLWLAWYTTNPSVVLIPAPWQSCLYWQWGTPAWGIAWGCESQEIDQNLYNGTLETFKLSYGLSNGETPMDYYLVRPNVAGEYRTIRKLANPNITGMKIGQVNANNSGKCSIGDEITYTSNVYVDGVLKAKTGDRWLHVYEANGAAIDGWIAEVHLGITYLTVEKIVATPPTEPTVTHVIKVYSDGKISVDDGVPY